MATIPELEKELELIKVRNKRVEADKEWETSLTRKVAIATSTYIVILIFFLVIKVERPLLSALVPAIAFILSTFSINFLKGWWLKRQS